MNNKARLISIIFAALALITGLIALQIYGAKQTLEERYEKEIKELLGKNEKLAKQFSQSEEEKKRIQRAMDEAKGAVDKIVADRDEWQKKYEIIAKEKEQLAGKISELSSKISGMPPSLANATTQTGKEAVPQQEKGYWANIIKERSALGIKLDALTNELTNIKLELEEALEAKKNLELAVSELTHMKDDLTRKLAYNEELIDNLSNEFTREVNDKQYILDQFNSIKSENSVLKTQIKDLTTVKIALEKNLVKQQEDVADLDKRLADTEDIVKSRIGDINQLKREVEDNLGADASSASASREQTKAVQLPPIVVYAQGPKAGIPTISNQKSGRVVSIDEANNFVVIDVGENEGVAINDRFGVFRNSRQIGTIQIIQLRKDISAGDIIESSDKIRADDIVKSL